MNDLLERDKRLVWHPYSQAKTAGDPIAITHGKDEFLFDADGKKYIDAVSSWWVTLHGHSNQHIADTIHKQLQTLEHVIFSGFTHEPAVELCERLLPLLPNSQSRFFFSDNGSTAVEIGLKMAIQFFKNKGEKRTKIIALEGAFHGETFGTMSIGDSEFLAGLYSEYLFDVIHIPVPYEGDENRSLEALKKVLDEHEVAAFIYEPLVQGASGMRMYSPAGLDGLIRACQSEGVFCIADEVMTGFYRTGKKFASDWLETDPDIMALSKGLTGGTLPLALTTCTEEVFMGFYSDDVTKTLYHGHSYTGNPVGCAAALASLDLMVKPETEEKVNRIAQKHEAFAQKLESHPRVKHVRARGTILALEVKTTGETSYFNSIRDILYNFYLERGVLLRPLGNVVYILPPLCTSNESLEKIYETILHSLDEL
ncbi:adenosylmethionine--8-amino-7-oxononanoate transaminase [bacterium SCSIO 12741]|nr:adenosylmethionine--8-amino-7-oxononanoate transaminase [bacterium SCSIO 12741]